MQRNDLVLATPPRVHVGVPSTCTHRHVTAWLCVIGVACVYHRIRTSYTIGEKYEKDSNIRGTSEEKGEVKKRKGIGGENCIGKGERE